MSRRTKNPAHYSQLEVWLHWSGPVTASAVCDILRTRELDCEASQEEQ